MGFMKQGQGSPSVLDTEDKKAWDHKWQEQSTKSEAPWLDEFHN